MDRDFLYALLNASGVSGNEAAVEKLVYDYMQGFADKVEADVMGNVTAVINPDVPFKVLMAGHADEIGLAVTFAEDNGLVRVSAVGGVYPTTYPGHKVKISTKNGPVYGAVVIDRELAKDGNMGCDKLRIDIGASSKEEALKTVEIGDTVVFDTEVRELLGNRLTSKSIDDRIGVFIVMEALKLAKEQGAVIGVYSTATIGEEVNGCGAFSAAGKIKPAMAIAVDVTFTTDYPGTNASYCGEVKLGEGPVLTKGPGIHKMLNECIEASASALSIKLQYELSGGWTHTDGDTIYKTGSGIPFTVVSIPLRYMHTPAEVVSMDDVQKTIELLAGFLCDCSENMELRAF